MIEYSIVLQAGGKSTRMGTDKAQIPFQGRTMIEHIIAQIRPLRKDMLLISNNPAAFVRLDLPIFSDVIPDWGALGGLYTALYHTPKDWALVLACDMPFIEPKLIRYMAGLAGAYDAVIPRVSEDGYAEPFRAFYNRRCLAPIREAIEAGRRRVDSFFESINPRFIERSEIERFDPALRSFFNVNTPQDLEEAERLAAEKR